MGKRLKNGIAAVALAGWAAGCATGPDFRPPAGPESESLGVAGDPTAEAHGPGGATQEFAAEMDVPGRWWELFGCPALDAAVAEALENSPTLVQAEARLRQAQEEYNAQAGGRRLPAVDAGLGARRQKVNPEAMGMQNAPAPDPFAVYNASVSVSYAFDLFGKNRRTLEALKAQVDRREFERAAARQTLAANVAVAMIRYAEAGRQLWLATEIANSREGQCGIAKNRLDAGGMSRREMEGQEQLWQEAQAARIGLEEDFLRRHRQVQVLLGREPGGKPVDALDLDTLRLPGKMPLRLPADVARQRPDIRAAEAVWHQACANVGVATADLYPQITLTASLGSQETDLEKLLSAANVWSFGGDLVQPVFHGGALRAKKRAALAAYDEAAAAYRETVLRGLQEVADTMDALAADARLLEARQAAEDHAQEALEIADRQHADGGLSTLAVLDERVRTLQTMGRRVSAQAARLADTAALFHALGGAAPRD